MQYENPVEKRDTLHAYLAERIGKSLGEVELSARGDDGLRELADRALDFVWKLEPGEFSVRVENRTIQSKDRCVVEILIRDQPFLVDTLHLNLRRLLVREKLFLHPQLMIDRGDDGAVSVIGSDARGREAYLYAEIPAIAEEYSREDLRNELIRVYGELRAVVEDHGQMIQVLREHADLVVSDDHPERREFLNWLSDGHFLFFGYRRYDVSQDQDDWVVRLDAASELGVLRGAEQSRFEEQLSGDDLPEIIRTRLAGERVIFFDKSRTNSIIHRQGRLDCVTIKIVRDGRVVGYGRFVGLLTHDAISTRSSSVPILQARLERILGRIGAEPGSHDYKAAIQAFDSLPIEFLFPFEVEDISRAIERILLAARTRSVEIVVAPDPRNRSFFVSAILPRTGYEEALRADLNELLIDKYRAIYIDSRSSFLDDDLALVHFFCSCAEDVDLVLLEELHRDVVERTRSWEDRFESALLEIHQETAATALSETYLSALPEEYRQSTSPSEVVADLQHLEALRVTGTEFDNALVRAESEPTEGTGRLKIYQRTSPYLTNLLPVFDQFGLRVLDAVSTKVETRAAGCFWIVTFRIEVGGIPIGVVEEQLLEGLRQALRRQVECDGLNRLVTGVGLDWRQVDLLRAYLAYAQQIGIGQPHRFSSETLLRRAGATRALLELFRARFDPNSSGDRALAEQSASERLAEEREQIPTAPEDRVFGQLQELMQATQRTNFYQRAYAAAHSIVLKLDPARVDQMPSPRPLAEIFVHSVEVAGVHLRGGRVARGGLRWSDRVLDYRTEVLGLMKTQMVKNGLIVPVGSKGVFVLKRPCDASGLRAQADRGYETFVSALLTVTDNIVDGSIVGPEEMVRHDGDDPYLVVAADKGTAHLSDVANRIAADRGFWLDDAFASGGSAGYDHKVEGITARGAWVCTQRHFLELGTDVEQDVFTAAGIGDMSGDVFGNGLLLARRAKLVAAFDHRHIFLDPDPDPEVSWAERKRLFELPRSSWQDYDASKISAGGGVFVREARAISLSPEAQRVLQVEEATLSGEELVRAVLCAPVDLLWNGGIGTYVRSTSESNEDAGDRANDAVRISAPELRARVVGEGGNLGLTQLARIEYALLGGRINTDAIDNSAGVDLSDHEVNFKILLASAESRGAISCAQRDEIMRSCVGAANEVVLSHNLSQSRCISMDQMRTATEPARIAVAANYLERSGGLDPELEFIPNEETRRARPAEVSYTRPELAVLLGYTKMLVKRELSRSEILDADVFRPLLAGYFPKALRDRFAVDIEAHRLEREIKATLLTNRVIDSAGVTLIPELTTSLGASVPDVIAAYHAVDRLLGVHELRLSVRDLPVSESARLEALLRIEDAVRAAARDRLGLERRSWLEPDEFEARHAQVGALDELLARDDEAGDRSGIPARATRMAEHGFDDEIGGRIERLPLVVRSLSVLSLSPDVELARRVELYERIGRETFIAFLMNRLTGQDQRDGWDRIAVLSIYVDMLETQRDLTRAVIAEPDPDSALAELLEQKKTLLAQVQLTADQIGSDGTTGLAALAVLSSQIGRLR